MTVTSADHDFDNNNEIPFWTTGSCLPISTHLPFVPPPPPPFILQNARTDAMVERVAAVDAQVDARLAVLTAGVSTQMSSLAADLTSSINAELQSSITAMTSQARVLTAMASTQCGRMLHRHDFAARSIVSQGLFCRCCDVTCRCCELSSPCGVVWCGVVLFVLI